MRHKKLNKRLGRNKSNRKQLLRSIVRGLFLSYKIETTLAKAKEARKLADRIMKYAISASLKDIREIESVMQDRALTSKIIKILAPLSRERKGGYTRIIKSGFRRGDSAEMAILELVDMPIKEEKQRKLKKQKPKAEETEIKAKPEPQKGEKVEGKVKEKTKETISLKEEKPALKSKAPKAEKKETPKAKPDRKPDREKSRPDKRGLFGKFRGFFKQQ
jgi:large subunit ribosomal protein L17